jgi:hypothetical protein
MRQYEHPNRVRKGDGYRHHPLSATYVEYTSMRSLPLILVLAASLLPFATAQAAPADLPETGQTTCYDPSGATANSVPCANTGQDGDLKAGVAWPNPRFTGATADCVTDNLTGLMWVRAPSNVLTTWINALTSAEGLTLCGFSDWRLPNVNELESLVNGESVSPAAFLNTQGFSGVQAGRYWSSSSLAGNTGDAWVIDMSDGSLPGDGKSDSRFVWPVRAGQ